MEWKHAFQTFANDRVRNNDRGPLCSSHNEESNIKWEEFESSAITCSLFKRQMEHSDEFFRLMEPQIRFWGKNFLQVMQYRQSFLWRTELFTDVQISLSQRRNPKAHTARTSQSNSLFLIAPSLCTKCPAVQKHHMPSLGVSCWSGTAWSQEMKAPKRFREGNIINLKITSHMPVTSCPSAVHFPVPYPCPSPDSGTNPAHTTPQQK